MSSDQHYEAGWYLADAFSETMRAARSMVQHREESQKKAVMSAIDRKLYPYFADFADMADICLEAKTDREVHQVLLMIRAQVWMRMCWWNDTKDEGWLFLEECGLSSNDPGQDGGIMVQPSARMQHAVTNLLCLAHCFLKWDSFNKWYEPTLKIRPLVGAGGSG